jgi:glycosyltransferase involved in cell wall biosynthesis
MNPAEFRLLIHHHAVAYVDETGELWLTAGIARWVMALAPHFQSIGLLLPQSDRRSSKQDTLITAPNVVLHSLGGKGGYWDRFTRMRRIQQVCQRAGAEADGLLIRGLTPRQYAVWRHTPVPSKAFLLVRSPQQRRMIRFAFAEIFSEFVNWFRERDFARIARGDTLLMANSPLYLPELEARFGKPAHFVPTNTIREMEFAPLAARPLNDPLRLLYVGRLHLLKGLRELLTAAALLQKQGQPCIVNIVAGLEEPVYTELRKLAEDLGIAEQVQWRGYVPFGPDLMAFYREADIFMLPSYTEGFPRVLWEAAANSCPVIATAVGGIPALFASEEQALLVPPQDVDALVTAVNRLIHDEPLRRRLIANAYQKALAYTVEACAQKLAALLAEEWT